MEKYLRSRLAGRLLPNVTSCADNSTSIYEHHKIRDRTTNVARAFFGYKISRAISNPSADRFRNNMSPYRHHHTWKLRKNAFRMAFSHIGSPSAVNFFKCKIQRFIQADLELTRYIFRRKSRKPFSISYKPSPLSHIC